MKIYRREIWSSSRLQPLSSDRSRKSDRSWPLERANPTPCSVLLFLGSFLIQDLPCGGRDGVRWVISPSLSIHFAVRPHNTEVIFFPPSLCAIPAEHQCMLPGNTPPKNRQEFQPLFVLSPFLGWRFQWWWIFQQWMCNSSSLHLRGKRSPEPSQAGLLLHVQMSCRESDSVILCCKRKSFFERKTSKDDPGTGGSDAQPG